MRQPSIDPSLFIQNRQRFVRQMKPDSIAIFHSNDPMPRNGDQHFPYRQHSDFFYLSGIAQKGSVLVLFPDSQKKELKEILFLSKETDHSRIWEGEKLSKDEGSLLSGIEKVFWLGQFTAVLHELLRQAKRVYLNGNESQGSENEVITRDQRMGNELMKKYPMHKYHRSQPLLRQLRMIKSAQEIELMKKAIEITGLGLERVMAHIYPGIWEYQIEAILTGTFLHEGASGHAYEPIIASGSSSCILHYISNNRVCKSGDLILMDFGAEYANYSSDISRTIPVNGRFNERQTLVYLSVLKILKETRDMMVPGMTLEDLNLEVGKMMTHALIDLGLLEKQDLKKDHLKNQPYRQFFMHGVAHHLGMDVHDLSNRFSPFQAGMVLTCEPGIYVQDEDIGIRLENNILITDEGPVDLTADIPIEIEEIVTIMQESTLSTFDRQME